MSQADKKLLKLLVSYALDHGYQVTSSGSVSAFIGPDRLCKTLVISISDFIERKIKQQVDNELLKLLSRLFSYSQDTILGSYEWYLIDDKKSPDGKRLIYLSGEDACSKLGFAENIVSVEQIINYRMSYFKAFLTGDIFTLRSDNHLMELRRKMAWGENLTVETKRIFEEIERPNRERLAQVFRVSFSNLLTDLGY